MKNQPDQTSPDRAQLEQWAHALEQDAHYRVLRKFTPPAFDATPNTTDKTALLIDCETTGLEAARDDIIELGMVLFHYNREGHITQIVRAFDQLQQPSKPIRDKITKITGITNEMVEGKSIDEDAVNDMVAQADLIIAHNALFDRPFLERAFAIFATKPWACSMAQVDWAGEGFEGTKLSYLAKDFGFFYDAHRAETDCLATIEVLTKRLPESGQLVMQALLDNARKPTFRLWAENAPFAVKDMLKARGYRWNGGDNNQPKAWYIDLGEADVDAELTYLKADIYGYDVQIEPVKITAFDRFSERI